MVSPVARQGDQVVGTDVHVVLVPSSGGPVPTPVSMPFAGRLVSGCSSDVLIEGRAAAVQGSVVVNQPPHVPTGGTFQRPPDNRGTVIAARPLVLVNGKPIACQGDRVLTCNDPAPAPTGTVATGAAQVLAG